MSNQKPKAPTPIVVTGTAPYQHRQAIPATVSEQDPYATIPPVRNGEAVPTNKVRTQFKPEEFARVINQHGYFVTWTKALLCPCVNPATNQASINCDTCDGSGFYYTDPIRTRAVMSSMERNQRTFEKFGSWVEGTSMCTVEPMYRLGHLDRIEMFDSVMPHSELMQKNNRRGLRAKLPDDRDSLRYRIFRMTALIFKPGSGTAPIKLEEDYHFKVDEDGWIQWLHAGDDTVPDDAWLSALYEYHPIYLVMSHPHGFRDGVLEKKAPEATVVALPIQALVKLDYLSDINTPLPSLCVTRAKVGVT